MAGSRTQFRLGPEDSSARLCANPQCTNNDPQQFTEKEVCGEDETSTIMECLTCKEETPKDQWNNWPMEHKEVSKELLTATLAAEIDGQNVDIPSGDTKMSMLYDVNRTSGSEFPGLSLDERAGGDVDDVTAAVAELSLPESGHMSREFSTDSIGELISLTPCTTCKEPLVKVSGRDELTLWHCAKCDAYYGVDDSFTMMEMYHTMSLLSESLENATLRTTMCPGGCGNDDPEKFLFDIIDDEVYLICKVCSKPQLIPVDNEEKSFPSPPSPEPSPTKSITKIQIQCDCGNDHPEAFAVHYGEPIKLICHVCDEELLILDPGLTKGNDSMLGDLDEETTFQPPKGRTEVKDVSMLKPGDHIAWHQSLAYWHHAVVASVGEIYGKVKIIHYTGPDKGYGGKGVIREEWQDIDLKKDALYRMDYRRCNPPEVVLRRARSRLLEAQYCLFNNNCEHFAQWCKTGVARSIQVESFADTLGHIKDRIVAYASKENVRTGIRMAKFAAKKYREMGTAASTGLAKASTDVAKSEASKAAFSFGKLDYAAVGLVIAIEGVRTYRDIRNMQQKKERGDISQKEFVRFSVKRSVQGVGGVTGTVAGGALGQVVIPIPIVGSLVGATLGAFIGEGLGTLVGRKAVSLVDGK